jgi:hypothetical protein
MDNKEPQQDESKQTSGCIFCSHGLKPNVVDTVEQIGFSHASTFPIYARVQRRGNRNVGYLFSWRIVL